MSLEAAIHQRWADSTSLSALLPPQRVTTGRSGGGSKTPYATILAAERRRLLPTNGGDAVGEAEVELCLWLDDFDAGEEIVEYIYSVYHLVTFELSGESATVRMRAESLSTEHLADGCWCWKITFTAKVCADLDS